MTKAKPAKMANGRTARPAFQLFSAPKKRVSIIAMMVGITTPTVAWMIATSLVISCRNCAQEEPCSTRWRRWSRYPGRC